jgi:hypothetical protein
LESESVGKLKLSKVGNIARSLCAGWTILLVVLISLGTFSSARIGTMTWGPQHDVWSAAIALSQIKFGLSGGLAYKEVEQAITNEVTTTKNIWDILDGGTQALLRDPSAITRGLKNAAALRKDQIAVPATKDGYITDWCEDLGYADFYNLAFRLFGVNAYSTHFLYVAILLLSVLLFQARFIRDNLPMATLTLSITALLLISSSAFFNGSVPSFAANRFLSTLGLVPLLHLVHAALRRRAWTAAELGVVVAQAAILAFVLAARGSTMWCLLAFAFIIIATACFRLRHLRWRQPPVGSLSAAWQFAGRSVARLGITGAVVVAVVVVVGLVRNAQIDERYFRDDNFPHHLLWHSAYLGLTYNPEWPKYKPFADVPDYGDAAGFTVFVHRMQERNEPAVSALNFYRARIYEKLIKREYLSFLAAHPTYALKLFFYYKPMKLIDLLFALIGSIPLAAGLLALGSMLLVFAVLAFSRGVGLSSYAELGFSFAFIWFSSMLPVFWAYPDHHVVADPALGTLLLSLAALSFAGVFLLQAGMKLRDMRRNVEAEPAAETAAS